ncbi:MAG: Crp/Fnr family transcriptional regulator [Flavicella sp.]
MENCINCKNSNCLIKKNTNEKKIKNFFDKKHTIKAKKGQQFIIEGTPAHGLFFAYSGKVKVVKTGVDDREQIVRFAGDGEVIGHRGGFGSSKYYAISAQTLENTTLCYFSKEDLKETLLNIPKLTFDFMLFYADELSLSETRVRKLAQMSVRERLIDSLLHLDAKFGSEESLLKLNLSRKEYAEYSGTTEEQVIRTFSNLKKEGLILSKGRKIGLVNREALKEKIKKHTFTK